MVALIVLTTVAALVFGVARAAAPARGAIYPLAPWRVLAYRVGRPFGSRRPPLLRSSERPEEAAIRWVPTPPGSKGHTIAVRLPEDIESDAPALSFGHPPLLADLGVDVEPPLAFSAGGPEAAMWDRALTSAGYERSIAPFLDGRHGAGFAVHDGELYLRVNYVPGGEGPARALETQAESFREPLADRLRALPERLLAPSPFILGDVERTHPMKAVLAAYPGTPFADRALDVLAQWSQSPAQSDGVRARAFALLVDHADSARLADALRAALRAGNNEVTTHALRLVRDGEGGLGPADLLAAAHRTSFGKPLLDALEPFEETDPDGVEGTSLAILAAGHPTEVTTRALAIVGRVGSLAAVRHVVPLRSGMLRDSAVKLAASRAIDAIQSRHDGAEAGGLSLVDPGPDEGGLTMVEADGAVSLIDEDATER